MTSLEPGQYAAVNGVEIYYEVHGSGQPLVMLHGGYSILSSPMLGSTMKQFLEAPMPEAK